MIIIKKPSFKKRFRYWLDQRMAKGTASMVKLLLIMVLSAVIFVTGIGVGFGISKINSNNRYVAHSDNKYDAIKEYFNNVWLYKNDYDNLDELLDDKAIEGLSEEALNESSSYIYNRPYEVTPSGIPSSAKGNCKIKYAFEGEKRVEHILDQHLKIGAHGELLRIYFIIDKQRKKIVIGSLPNHLEY